MASKFARWAVALGAAALLAASPLGAPSAEETPPPPTTTSTAPPPAAPPAPAPTQGATPSNPAPAASQPAKPEAPKPDTAAPAAPTPAPAEGATTTAPAPAAPETAKPEAPKPEAPKPDTPKPGEPATTPGSATASETVELKAQPAATVEGRADRDNIYSAILASLGVVRSAIDKAGLKAAGKPIAVFLEADDTGFKYRAEIPLESAPEGKTALSDAVKLGLTPAGKAMRFEHRGAYDDIDATYDAITAYLDEKGVEAQDIFIEQYLNDVKTTDDPTLQVDIFVLLK